VVVPAETPHGFKAVGDDVLRVTSVHPERRRRADGPLARVITPGRDRRHSLPPLAMACSKEPDFPPHIGGKSGIVPRRRRSAGLGSPAISAATPYSSSYSDSSASSPPPAPHSFTLTRSPV
jgi:hypothetical protein